MVCARSIGVNCSDGNLWERDKASQYKSAILMEDPQSVEGGEVADT